MTRMDALITPESNAVLETCKNCIKAVFAGESVIDFLRDVGMSPQTFHETLRKYPELQDTYADAKRFRAEMVAGEVIEIADSEEDTQKARNRIQARQWYASKILPKEYGDRMDINVSQTIDIGSALAEARSRALRPVCDQPQTLEAQDVDFKDVSPVGASDTESLAPRKSLTARVDEAATKPVKKGRKPKEGSKP